MPCVTHHLCVTYPYPQAVAISNSTTSPSFPYSLVSFLTPPVSIYLQREDHCHCHCHCAVCSRLTHNPALPRPLVGVLAFPHFNLGQSPASYSLRARHQLPAHFPSLPWMIQAFSGAPQSPSAQLDPAPIFASLKDNMAKINSQIPLVFELL